MGTDILPGVDAGFAHELQNFPKGISLEPEPDRFPGAGVGTVGTSVGILISVPGLESKII